MNEIIVKVEEWILSDGNYAHFKEGDQLCFALTVAEWDQLRPASRTECFLNHISDNHYQIQSKLVYYKEGIAVVDTGNFSLFIEGFENRYSGSRKKIGIGEVISFTASLAIDEFVYKEGRHRQEAMPPLLYEWQIQGIEVVGKEYSYLLKEGEYGLDLDNAITIREQIQDSDLETQTQLGVVYKSADHYLIRVSRTSKLPRFTVMNPGRREHYLSQFRKAKADRELYELILQQKKANPETALIGAFVERNLETLAYNTGKREQSRQYEKLAIDFFEKIIEEFSYHDCLLTDESTVSEFMPDHSHEQILYLVGREYGVELAKLDEDFTFIDVLQQLKLRRET